MPTYTEANAVVVGSDARSKKIGVDKGREERSRKICRNGKTTTVE
jgi:hypothetical protein